MTSLNEAQSVSIDLAVPEPSASEASRSIDKVRRFARVLDEDRFVTLRYVLVAGVIGVPGSMVQLTAMLYLYSHVVGGYGTIVVNALWLLNFEIGLLRNFALHCAYTWRMKPNWSRLRHAHVAALGALVIDLSAFNIVLQTTGILPLAQLMGASSGFGFNYLYNRFKTFRTNVRTAVIERVTP